MELFIQYVSIIFYVKLTAHSLYFNTFFSLLFVYPSFIVEIYLITFEF